LLQNRAERCRINRTLDANAYSAEFDLDHTRSDRGNGGPFHAEIFRA
jgi:hypothetical protein